ncbi:hypothetical protein ABT095_27340 [Kitasatospora sp. NPDC002227]|uniref:hypothetical protein n=1 Tax=Kitasatospora sp. NPDC002227 TaxID=3154773 RepID=UPI003329E675
MTAVGGRRPAALAFLALAGLLNLNACTENSCSGQSVCGTRNVQGTAAARPGGSPSGVVVTHPLDPGNAVLPPDVHISGERSSAGCTGVNYFAVTAQQFESGDETGERLVGPAAVDVSVQSSSQEAVLLTGLQIHPLHRDPLPTTGILIKTGGCGVGQAARPFRTTLDRPDAPIYAQPDPGGPDASPHPPVTFPFKVLPSEPEVFRLTTDDTVCFCTYSIEVDWTVAGKNGRTVLDDSGAGYPASAAAPGLPAYELTGPGLQLTATTFQKLFP